MAKYLRQTTYRIKFLFWLVLLVVWGKSLNIIEHHDNINVCGNGSQLQGIQKTDVVRETSGDYGEDIFLKCIPYKHNPINYVLSPTFQLLVITYVTTNGLIHSWDQGTDHPIFLPKCQLWTFPHHPTKSQSLNFW